MVKAAWMLGAARRLRRAAMALAGVERAPRPDRPAFGLEWMRRYLPHYLRAEPSPLHLELASELRDFHLVRGRRLCLQGPRGSAKTTWLKGYTTYCAVEGIEPFILLLAETGSQSAGYLRSVREELEANPRLADDYPHATGVGSVWQDGCVKTRNGVLILARGAGGRILGRTHRANRPSLVIGDDLNERRDAYSPTLRRRKLDWFERDVLNVGDPFTNYLAAGTPIHREAIVCKLRDNPVWSARSYKSIRRWPDRMDLWHEWERSLTNLADVGRVGTARAFYDANAAAMEAGASVLWPSWEPLYDLMVKRAEIGAAAFASEKQDTPGTDGAAEWPAEYFDHGGFWFEEWPRLLVKLQSLDPSKGVTAEPGDYQAHVWGGLGADGVIYVDADLRREPVTEMVGRALDIYASFGPQELRAEGNNTMGLLQPELDSQVAARRLAGTAPGLVAYSEVIHSDPKLARIRAAGGYLARRQIRVRNSPGGRMLVDQWRDVPGGEYDDGPDAAGTLVRRLERLVNGGD